MESDVILHQSYSHEKCLEFIQDILPILKDPRYIRVDGKPLLVIYRPLLIPDLDKVVQAWRHEVAKAGLPGLWLVCAQTFGLVDPRPLGFDAAVEFPPSRCRIRSTLTMRVLHVIARLNVGGTARYITQLANELPKHGIETFVATGFVQGAEVEDPSAQSIDLIRVPAMGRSINPIKDHFAHKQLKKIIAEVKPDIIHTHTFKAGYVIRMKQQAAPVIHTFHGHLLDDPEFSGFKSKLIIALERKFAKKSAKLVTVGRRVADELLEQQIGYRNQFVNIPPGVVAVNVTPKAQALKNLNLEDSGAPIVGWIARVTGVKNPMRALEVADALPDTHFVMAGGGDLLEQVKATAPANVSVIGWAEAADLFGASDIILSTSENEGMPVALIEAQLAGKPVVATDVGSVSEVILNHETGIVTNKNAGSIASAVESLVLDKATREEMGRLAIARSQTLFSVERMINAHIELYKSIVK